MCWSLMAELSVLAWALQMDFRMVVYRGQADVVILSDIAK